MKLVVGLGNPGKKYEQTRHNVGWLVLDELNQRLKTKNKKHILKIKNKIQAEIWEGKIQDEKVVLAKPMTFMNNSGEAVKKLVKDYPPKQFQQFKHLNNLYLIHDDLDIPLGSFKIQLGKGPKGHNGVESVERALGTKGFWRVRIGIENRQIKQLEQLEHFEHLTGEKYVLSRFTQQESEILKETVSQIAKALTEHLTD